MTASRMPVAGIRIEAIRPATESSPEAHDCLFARANADALDEASFPTGIGSYTHAAGESCRETSRCSLLGPPHSAWRQWHVRKVTFLESSHDAEQYFFLSAQTQVQAWLPNFFGSLDIGPPTTREGW